MKKYFVVLSVALVLGLLAGMLAFSTVSADPIIGTVIQVPVVKVDEDWETWIHVFNKSQAYDDTGVIVFLWGDYSELCPSNSPPPICHFCMKVPWNGVWTLKDVIKQCVTTSGGEQPRSAMIFSIDESKFNDACLAADGIGHIDAWWTAWFDKYPGEELAVVVDRKGPNDFDTVVSSAYTGISKEMEGEDNPYRYFAPYMMKGYHDLDTIMYLQNSGKFCTSVWIQYQEQGVCAFTYSQHIEQLAPGETYVTTVPAELSAPWLGSAYIEAEQPLGIIVDQTSLAPSADRAMLLSWRGQPYQPAAGEGVYDEDLDAWEWDTEVYGDLVFREWNGWNSSVQVQNLTKISQPTFVTVDFMNNSGDEILFLADWICPGGSETFYQPVVRDLGFYLGAVEIKSHEQVDWPGGTHRGAPIFAIVDLKNATRGQGGAYNAHPRFEKEQAWDLSLPLLAKKHQNMTSLFVIRNNSNCAKIKPEIKFKNQEGRVVCKLNSFWLHPKHSKLIDLANIGCLTDGWVGAAEIVIVDWEIFCNEVSVENPEFDYGIIMPSAVVVNRAPPGVTALGDETRVYEGFPIQNYCIPQCFGELTVNVVSDEDGGTVVGLKDASVTVETLLWCNDTWTGTEDAAGTDTHVSIAVPGDDSTTPGVNEAGDYSLTVVKSGYLLTEGVTEEDVLDCGATRELTVTMKLGASISGVTFYEIGTVNGYDDPAEAEAGATVTLYDTGTNDVVEHPDTGVEFITTSDTNGVYKFVGVPAGTYDIKAVKGLLDGQVLALTVVAATEYPGRDIRLN